MYINFKYSENLMMTRTLDLGCGLNIRNPYGFDEVYGLDIRTCDLAVEPIPFPDNYFDCISALDFIEHIPRILYIPQR
jgi:hypothetical protein